MCVRACACVCEEATMAKRKGALMMTVAVRQNSVR